MTNKLILFSILVIALALTACGTTDNTSVDTNFNVNENIDTQDLGVVDVYYEESNNNLVQESPMQAIEDTAGNSELDLEQFFTVIGNHRLVPGMILRDVLDLGFESLDDLDALDDNWGRSRWGSVFVDYTPLLSNSDLDPVTDVRVFLRVIRTGPLNDFDALLDSVLVGVIVQYAPNAQINAIPSGAIVRSFEMYRGINLTQTLSEIIDILGEYDSYITAEPATVVTYHHITGDNSTEIGIRYFAGDEVVRLINWEVSTNVLDAIGVEWR